MLNNAFRKELIILLGACAAVRPPALRRSKRAEWLYATDIPVLLSECTKEQLESALQGAGWECSEENGWLLLRKDAEEPPEGWYSGRFGPEAACCRSILERHQGRQGCAANEAQRLLIKAGEEGEAAYEEACLVLHRQWAERLRKRLTVPALSIRYFERERTTDHAV